MQIRQLPRQRIKLCLQRCVRRLQLLYLQSQCGNLCFGRIDVGGAAVDRHCLAYTKREGSHVQVTATEDADVLLLAALPLNEPVAASGTWVLSSNRDLLEADRDYAAGAFGRPWDHTLSDEDWRAALAAKRAS